MPDEKPSASPGSQGLPFPATSPGTRRRHFAVRLLKGLAITVVVLVLLCVIGLVIADRATSKPEFCGSCHIMEPYYASWQADVHGGKLEVACIDCHYAPGERDTFMAKMRGLSQVTSYVSGRYGASRPRAHVDNRSCMTSKCHGDMGFMDKQLSVGTVKFVHAKHLQFDQKKQQTREKELQELEQTLQQLVGPERFAKLEEAAREAIPAKLQAELLTRMVGSWNVKLEVSQLERFAQLHHWQVRVAQMVDMQCTTCHSYGAPAKKPLLDLGGGREREKAHGDNHFSVKTTSCFTCHFNNEGFNTGTGTCLMCHTLPAKEILVHSPEKDPQLKAEFPKKTVHMDHQTILQRKV